MIMSNRPSMSPSPPPASCLSSKKFARVVEVLINAVYDAGIAPSDSVIVVILTQTVMLRATSKLYTFEQIELMWQSVAYNDCRRYAFFDGRRWQHPDRHFDNVDVFAEYIERNGITDVHVKALDGDGGREWVVDVDVHADDDDDLQAKIRVATATFMNFFGKNATRIMHSGNRGIHVWLRIDRFPMGACKSVRENYYKVFVPPKTIEDPASLPEGCFAAAYVEALNKDDKISKALDKPLLYYWPAVDKHVFCNLNQIRVPYSYNFKGRKFSTLLH
ncbi:LEF-1 [Alphabaculovirus myunipunctae]|uniref:LEF-1 n=1 Tax=Mythimna unipuncta nucleopolyhedrovirus TaxID=447897 RepID=A0A2K9VS43_9ABAC|nr:LEF-1 [Mythimna unipuncta nucleopolyhedrovirus]AUV65277.1 LEF-1 [Mythimna unipuncta nucleopolyhedrovirus]